MKTQTESKSDMKTNQTQWNYTNRYDQTIIGFNFTWAIQGGAWIRRANGDHRWESFEALSEEKGNKWIDDMVARQGQFTGCEVKV